MLSVVIGTVKPGIRDGVAQDRSRPASPDDTPAPLLCARRRLSTLLPCAGGARLLTSYDERHSCLFIPPRQCDRLLATLPREVQGFRFPTQGAADDDPPPGFQQTQAVADITFGSGKRAHQLGVATRDHPACALLIPPEPG